MNSALFARALMAVVFLACAAAAQGQQSQNAECWPWRTTVSALPFGDPGIFGNSAEEVCRALIDRNNPQIVNGGTVSVTKTFTGLVDVGGNGASWYCGYNSVAVRVYNGDPVPSESGPRALEGVVRERCEPTDSNACGVSNPTEPALGIKTETQTDYAGSGAHPLSLVRSYRSQAITPRNLDSVDRWHHNYAMSLEVRPQSYGAAMGLVARRADGKGLLFSQISPATWRATSGTKDWLTEQRDANNVLLGFTYKVFEDDSTETYDANGRLLAIKARNGWLTTPTYSDAATPTTVAPAAGLLIAVRNHFGRELRFTYNATGRIAQVLAPGAVADTGAGNTTSPIRYAYDEAASLGAGVPAQSQLSSVTWQDGSVRRYHYENTRWPQALTGITDEAGIRWATYTYDEQGRVIRSEHVGGADRADFRYDQAPSNRRRTTVTTYASGSPSSAAYEFIDQNSTRLTYSVSAPCQLCGSTQQQSTYNAAGDPTKQIAHDGNVTFIAYDAKGRETERATFPASFDTAPTRPALANASKVVSTKWHATFNLPTQIAEPNRTTANTYNSKGMLTGTSWTATTDDTGAAKFSAVKTGSTYATGYGYNANSLVTSLVSRETPAGSTVATEISRWTATYSAAGDIATEVKKYTAANPPRADEITRYTSRTPDGLPLRIVTADGKTVMLTYKPRAMVNDISVAGTGVATTRTQFFYNAVARPTEVLLPDNSRVVFEYVALGRLSAVSDTAGNKFQYSFTTDGSIQERLDTGDAVALDQRVLAAYDPLGSAIAGAALPVATASVRQAPLSGMALAQTGAPTQNASVADSLVLSTSKAKRASCIAACVAAGTFAGSAGGRFVGGAIGGTAGGVLGTALPGVGTAAVGTAGAIAGGAGGARAGAWAGSLAGAAVAAAVCPEVEEECDLQARVDGDRCVAEAGPRYGRRGVAICQHSAMQRYAECLRLGRSGIRTPLAGADTPL